MSSCYYLFLFGIILLSSMSLPKAAALDNNCTDTPSCNNEFGATCQAGTCQCEAPWYLPCLGACEMERGTYQGEGCRRDENCVANSRCDNATKTCVCRDSFTAFNGLCYKKNNETCGNSGECWSNHCDVSSSRCTCNFGYEPSDDGRCRIKFSRLYQNWSEANKSNDFCSEKLSCLNILAICSNDSQHREKFCQCPSAGYNTNQATQQCDIIEIERLSPMNELSPNDTSTCFFCKSDNAVCASAGTKSTCWCTAGYDKVGDKCERKRTKLIFPSPSDPAFQSYGSNCTSNTTVSDQFCVCANYHEFESTTRPCKKIERKWISESYQYGLCTRITSDGKVQTPPNNGLCPYPLQCRAHDDKNVCACGLDQILEQGLANTSICVYRRGRNAPDSNISCTTGTDRINNICECKSGYIQADEGRRCELILRPDANLGSCDGNKSTEANRSCTERYGNTAQYCRLGECRCTPGISFASDDNSVCYGYVNVSQPATSYCPPNSQGSTSTLCLCSRGYRASNDQKRCDKVPLYNANENPVPNPSDIEAADCNIFPKDEPVDFDNSARVCRCQSTSFKTPIVDPSQCWALLYTNLTRVPDRCSIPNSEERIGSNTNMCACKKGFRPSGNSRQNCEPIRTQLEMVYTYALDPISDPDCREIFGILSVVTNESRCICDASKSFSNGDKSRCYAILRINTGFPALADKDCPKDASIQALSPGICECNKGFITTNSGHDCITAEIPLSGNKLTNSSSTCGNLTNDHCTAKYGDGSFCENSQCWCDAALSYKTNENQCELFSKYVFPGQHERNNFSCNADTDCIDANTVSNSVECRKLNAADDYKVCVCKQGWFLNPKAQTCETRCPSNCNDRPNSECNGYECKCKNGFIEVNNTCITNPNVLALYKPCNSSFTAANSESIQCDARCGRGRCASAYKDTGSACVQYNFDSDRCAAKAYFCASLIANSECYLTDNKCICTSGYYRNGNTCVLPVNSKCATDDQCGQNEKCVGKRCRCGDNQRETSGQDAYGRPITRCINNGVDHIRFSPILLLFVVLSRVFFA